MARSTSSPTRTDRLGPEDWVQAALSAIAAGGLGAVSIERLAKELGATKGSFYWHFKGRPALIAAALDGWEERDTDQIIERASQVDDPRQRLRAMFRIVFDEGRPGTQIDANLLADADDPIVAAALERVAAKRLGFIEETFRAMGADAVRERALLTFTAFLGLVQLRRTAPALSPRAGDSDDYINRLDQWLLPEPRVR